MFYQVLLYCHAALTELPGVVKQRKCAGNIQHMTGVITFYLSKVFALVSTHSVL